MTRKVFYSFHYQRDGWRASKVRNIGVVEGNPPASDNKWEEVLRGGDAGIQRWIDAQLENRTCTIVLIGAETANRRWVKYEIEKSWNSGKDLFGIRIHKILDHNQQTSIAGANPFDVFFFEGWTQAIHSRESLRSSLRIQC
ncbi:TIR domain-containing protein [Achromobacter aloeverae]